MIHVCFALSPIPFPLRRVVHALQQQKKSHHLSMAIRLDDYQEIKGVSLLGLAMAY